MASVWPSPIVEDKLRVNQQMNDLSLSLKSINQYFKKSIPYIKESWETFTVYMVEKTGAQMPATSAMGTYTADKHLPPTGLSGTRLSLSQYYKLWHPSATGLSRLKLGQIYKKDILS